jgi:hypothetical protein
MRCSILEEDLLDLAHIAQVVSVSSSNSVAIELSSHQIQIQMPRPQG